MITLVEANRGEVFVDSALVARKFGMKHNKLVSVIENVLDDFPDLRGISNTPKTDEKHYIDARIYRGQEYMAYMMSLQFFSLVAMRFTTKKAREWQRKFNSAFYELESQLSIARINKENPLWVQQRRETSLLRKSETDTIKEFVDYALAQGSTNAGHYYSLFTNATYRALGLMQHKIPKLRDTLDSLQLSWLTVAESIVKSSLQRYMEEGINYKKIYILVRDELERFVEPLTLIHSDVA